MANAHYSMINNNSDRATIRYRLNIPHTLYSISPSLAALHASRATALHPEISAVLHPTHCPKCGTYRFSGDHSPYPVNPPARKKRRHATSPQAKSFRRRCHICGFLIDTLDDTSAQLPGDTSRTGDLSIIPRTEESGQEPPRGDLPPGTIPTTECPTPPNSQEPHHKPSHTKTTLKDMLSHDRHREDVVKSHKKQKESHGGLAAFLKEL